MLYFNDWYPCVINARKDLKVRTCTLFSYLVAATFLLAFCVLSLFRLLFMFMIAATYCFSFYSEPLYLVV